MVAIEVSVHISAPIEQVWSRLSDLSSHSQWMAEAESIEFVSDRQEGLGTVMRVMTKVGPLRTADILEVTEWTAPTSIGIVHRGVVRGSGRFELSPLAGGTRFTWSEVFSLPWSLGGSLGELVAKPVLRAIWRHNLQRFSEVF